MSIKYPKLDEIYRHTNNNLYQIILFTNVEGTKEKYPTTIVYKNIVNGMIYSRPANDWYRSMELAQEYQMKYETISVNIKDQT